MAYTFRFLMLLACAVTVVLCVPAAPALAQNPTPECQALIEQFNNAKINDQNIGESVLATLPKYCMQSTIYTKILELFYYLVGIVATAAYIYGGYLYMISGASEASKTKGKEVILYTTLGVVVVVSAAMVVNIISKLVIRGAP